jgi:hypothetical protein
MPVLEVDDLTSLHPKTTRVARFSTGVQMRRWPYREGGLLSTAALVVGTLRVVTRRPR